MIITTSTTTYYLFCNSLTCVYEVAVAEKLMLQCISPFVNQRERQRDGQSGICVVDARQRDKAGKDVQQVRVIKGRDRNVLKSEESVYRR